MPRAQSKWKSVNVDRDLLEAVKATCKDAKYLSEAGLINRAVGEWLTNIKTHTTLTQLQQSLPYWTEQERQDALIALATSLVEAEIPEWTWDILINSVGLSEQAVQKIKNKELPDQSTEMKKLCKALNKSPKEVKSLFNIPCKKGSSCP